MSTNDASSGVPDVMRGEETQIIGALPDTGRQVALLPGSHSKWAWVEDGAIVSFASFMTGEVYAALVGHTILGGLMPPDAPADTAAFERGVRYGLEAPGALLSRIFSARTLGLTGILADSALPSYLSGLLIGSEIGGALQMRPHTAAPVLLGTNELTALYARALGLAGIEARVGPEECAAAGIVRIWRAGSLLAI